MGFRQLVNAISLCVFTVLCSGQIKNMPRLISFVYVNMCMKLCEYKHIHTSFRLLVYTSAWVQIDALWL